MLQQSTGRRGGSCDHLIRPPSIFPPSFTANLHPLLHGNVLTPKLFFPFYRSEIQDKLCCFHKLSSHKTLINTNIHLVSWSEFQIDDNSGATLKQSLMLHCGNIFHVISVFHCGLMFPCSAFTVALLSRHYLEI